MLQVSGLTKVYGDRTLFEKVSFSMSSGERLGLVGRNGSGKSTLFRLILNEESADNGGISLPKGYRVGHLAQHLSFSKSNIVDEVCLGLKSDERDQTYRGEIILSGLGFSESDYLKSPDSFSGGFQIRLNLAKLLLSEPNLLLLDEPTNYLDILSARWLSNFLAAWSDELIIISHDRNFMDEVTTHTMFIHRGSIRKVRGGTKKLYEQVALDEEIYEKTRLNEEKKRKDLETFINRFRAQASKASLVQSKIKALERMGEREELASEASLDFRFCHVNHPGKVVIDIKKLSFNYPNSSNLIDQLSLRIGKTDRVGIIGKNGKGKSTLLKLLAGELSSTGGDIELSPNAEVGYFGQTNISRLDSSRTVEEEIGAANPELGRSVVRAICGTMMFSGDSALKKIEVLSGGEKSRVLLGRLLAQPSNVLLLDEPTNHLDMESIEALTNSLRDYPGAVVIVTHNEMILESLVNRLVVFQGERPQLFDFDYEYFLTKEGWHEEGGPTQHKSKNRDGEKSGEKVRVQNKEQRKLEKKISKTEKYISNLESEVQNTKVRMAKAYEESRHAEAQELADLLSNLEKKIEEGFELLENLDKDYQSIG